MTAERVAVGPAPGPLKGKLRVPGDKSIAHRAIILNACGRGRAVVSALPQGLDVKSTVDVMSALGTLIEPLSPGTVSVTGRAMEFAQPAGALFCGNSGTTMRLVAGLLAGQPFQVQLDGDESLSRRPMRRVADPLARMGAHIETTDGRAPLRVGGKSLHGYEHHLEVASAQVKSALLLAGLGADGPTSVTEPVLSRDHTERMLAGMGVAVEREGLTVSLQGPAVPSCVDVELCGDPSSAAFIAVAAAMTPGSDVIVERICTNPTRTGFVDILRRMGADIDLLDQDDSGVEPLASLRVRGSDLSAVDIGAAEVPASIDELPVIAVAAALASGKTRISGAGELRVKESDRVATIAAMLSSLGAKVVEKPDGMEIEGSPELAGGVCIDAHGDHRVAMAAAVAALSCAEPVLIDGAGSVAVSYPGFFEQLEELSR